MAMDLFWSLLAWVQARQQPLPDVSLGSLLKSWHAQQKFWPSRLQRRLPLKWRSGLTCSFPMAMSKLKSARSMPSVIACSARTPSSLGCLLHSESLQRPNKPSSSRTDCSICPSNGSARWATRCATCARCCPCFLAPRTKTSHQQSTRLSLKDWLLICWEGKTTRITRSSSRKLPSRRNWRRPMGRTSVCLLRQGSSTSAIRSP